MKTLGMILLICGFILALVAIFMDSNVGIDNPSKVFGITSVPNINLIILKFCLLIFSGIMAIVGTLMYFLSGVDENKNEYGYKQAFDLAQIAEINGDNERAKECYISALYYLINGQNNEMNNDELVDNKFFIKKWLKTNGIEIPIVLSK